MAEEEMILPPELCGEREASNANDTSPGRSRSRSRENVSGSGLSQLSRKAIASKVLKRNLMDLSQQSLERRRIISEKFARNGCLAARHQNGQTKLQNLMANKSRMQDSADNNANRRSVTISELRGFLNQNRNRGQFSVQIGHPENGYPNIQLTVTPRANEKGQENNKLHSRNYFGNLGIKPHKYRQNTHSSGANVLPTLNKQCQTPPSIATTASSMLGYCNNNNHILSNQELEVEHTDDEGRLNSSVRLRAPVVVRNHQIVSSGRSRSGKLMAEKLRLLSAKKLSYKELIDRWLEDSFSELRV